MPRPTAIRIKRRPRQTILRLTDDPEATPAALVQELAELRRRAIELQRRGRWPKFSN